jgi:hypothetical protein
METKVTTKDLIGDLENFPIEVVEKMLEKQYKQVNKKDVSVFQDYKCSDTQRGGFHWENTIEGHEFWSDVIRGKKFDLFFKRYPRRHPLHTKSKAVYIRGDVNNGANVIKELERRGGINKYDYGGNADALYFIDPVTNYIAMASKMEEALQNLLKTYHTEITYSEKVIELTMEEIAEKFGVDADKLRIKK